MRSLILICGSWDSCDLTAHQPVGNRSPQLTRRDAEREVCPDAILLSADAWRRNRSVHLSLQVVDAWRGTDHDTHPTAASWQRNWSDSNTLLFVAVALPRRAHNRRELTCRRIALDCAIRLRYGLAHQRSPWSTQSVRMFVIMSFCHYLVSNRGVISLAVYPLAPSVCIYIVLRNTKHI